jgi:hypothetical protein
MSGRERQDPDDRFAGDEHLFDLAASARDLQGEEQEARHGHRQVTLVHDDGITVVLFAFEAGGQLANHSADGLVMTGYRPGRRPGSRRFELAVPVGESARERIRRVSGSHAAPPTT